MTGFLGLLKSILIKRGGNLHPQAFVGRFLIALSLLLIAATPFTEHLWTFDRFLRGGQDFELTVVSLVVFFCLVLLLARYAQHGLSVRLVVRRWLTAPHHGTSPLMQSSVPNGSHAPLPDSLWSERIVPLRI